MDLYYEPGVKHNVIVDEDLCFLACDTILEKYCLWTDEAQQRLYDLVINGYIPQSKDNKSMIKSAFWLTRFLLFSLLRKENKDGCSGCDKKDS